MIDMPYPGMVLNFKATGIQYKITCVSSEYRQMNIELISVGTLMHADSLMGRTAELTLEELMDMQRAGFVDVLLPIQPTFQILT